MSMVRPISLFNTLDRKVEPVAASPDAVRIYTCGPTVYNFAHIGNLRTFLFQDLMKRTLRASGRTVRHCMNITDVEDKIIRDSQKDLAPDATNEERHGAMSTLTERYTQAFLEDLETLRILRPDVLPRATDHIPHMIRLVKDLEAKGLAYAREGSVYYRIAAFPEYGALARLDKEGMRQGASEGVSGDADEYERDAASDFVLWKAAKEGEPWWDSPWGPGRPGWHIECSAMGIEHLGEHVDIHTGGVDLIFPHHENEIAQSEGCLGHRWVDSWVHGEFLMVEGEKMSKSLGNFYTLRDLVEKGIDPIAFRFAIQSNHYRKLYNFSFEGLKAAENALKRIRAFRRRMEDEGAPAGQGEWKEALDPRQRLAKAREDFWAAMSDDLNTPEALAAIFTLISDLNSQDDRIALSRAERDEVLAFLDETDSIFAAWSTKDSYLDASTLDQQIKDYIKLRNEAREQKNWAESDRLRDLLKLRGINLEDQKGKPPIIHRNDGSMSTFYKKNWIIRLQLEHLLSIDPVRRAWAHKHTNEDHSQLFQSAIELYPSNPDLPALLRQYQDLVVRLEPIALEVMRTNLWNNDQLNTLGILSDILEKLESITGNIIH